MDFGDPSLLVRLEAASDPFLDSQEFGIIGMARDGTVVLYNRAESELSGLRPEGVIGRHYFTEVAPCTNNYMVAQKYEDEGEGTLDESLDYVFTFRMKPTKVRLRLLKSPSSRRQYLLVKRA